MKPIEYYQYDVVITLLPFPLRHSSVLRIEINPTKSYPSIFNNFVEQYRKLGFSINEDKSSTNQTEYKNVIEFNLEPTIKIGELASDLEEDLSKLFESVHNTVRIKKELRK